jgi:hypothetical protein
VLAGLDLRFLDEVGRPGRPVVGGFVRQVCSLDDLAGLVIVHVAVLIGSVVGQGDTVTLTS